MTLLLPCSESFFHTRSKIPGDTSIGIMTIGLSFHMRSPVLYLPKGDANIPRPDSPDGAIWKCGPDKSSLHASAGCGGNCLASSGWRMQTQTPSSQETSISTSVSIGATDTLN